MTTEPLDTAAIMAAHKGLSVNDSRAYCVNLDHGDATAYPCETFRLAADLAAAREREADAWDEGWRSGALHDGTDDRPLNPYRAALVGEGASSNSTACGWCGALGHGNPDDLRGCPTNALVGEGAADQPQGDHDVPGHRCQVCT